MRSQMLLSRRPKRRARKPAARRGGTKPRAREQATAEQRRLDLIGLALIGAGIYVGGVLYAGWDGGQVGVRWRLGWPGESGWPLTFSPSHWLPSESG